MADIAYTKPTWVNGSTVPISAANLQAISDAVDDICHLANRGGAILDADTVSGYGIGIVDNASNDDADLDLFEKGGFYRVAKGSTGSHFPVGQTYGALIVIPIAGTADYTIQKFIKFDAATPEEYIRLKAGAAWSDWYKVWNSYSDGNDGQPPAPKPTEGTPAGGANGVGKYIVELKTSGTGPIYYSGFSNLTGIWILDCLITVTATGVFIGRFTGVGSGVYASNTDTNNTYTLTAWRQS